MRIYEPEQILGEFFVEFEFDDGNAFEQVDEWWTLVEDGDVTLHDELFLSVVPIFK